MKSANIMVLCLIHFQNFSYLLCWKKNKEFNLKFSFGLDSDCNIFHVRWCFLFNTTMASLKHSIFQNLSILHFNFTRLWFKESIFSIICLCYYSLTRTTLCRIFLPLIYAVGKSFLLYLCSASLLHLICAVGRLCLFIFGHF